MLSLPDAFADLARGVSDLFGDSPFAPGKVIDQAGQVFDAGGSIVASDAPVQRDCLVQISKATQAMQQAEGYLSGDMLFAVLASTLQGDLGTDAVINVLSGPFAGKWQVSGIVRDTAGIAWSGSGRKL